MERKLERIVREEILLTSTKESKLWRVIIAHVLKGHRTWKKEDDKEEKVCFGVRVSGFLHYSIFNTKRKCNVFLFIS